MDNAQPLELDGFTVFIIKNSDGVPCAQKIENKDLDNIHPSAFLSRDEIVDHLAATLSNEDKNDLISFEPDELTVLHFSAGRQIRNAYGMWLKNNPYINHKDPMADTFPDQYSQSVIVALHSRLTKELGDALAFDDSKQALFDLD